MASSRKIFRTRLLIVGGGVLLIALLFIGQLFMLQIVRGDYYQKRAERQYTSTDRIPFDRGDILMRKKHGETIALATLASGFSVAIIPQKIVDEEQTFEKLYAIVPTLEKEAFMRAASDKDDRYEEIATRVSEEEGRRIADLSLQGVLVVRERWRVYPGETLAAHTVGILGFQGDSHVREGKYGLEKYYADVLNRGDTSLYVNFFAEVFTELGKVVFDSSSRNEGTLEITLEPSIQAHLEEQLATLHTTWGSALSGGIIMDPKTGAIYALASLPTFNPNNLSNIDPSILRNPLVENVYEFGSIMKPLTIAAALDSNAVDESYTYRDTGSIVVDGRTIRNFDGKARGTVPLQEILNQSLNVGTADVLLTMGKTTFKQYLERLRFGEETGIDLPGEVPGMVTNLESPRDVEFVTASFGQGIAITPIQMARALATLANDGALPQPHIGMRIMRPHALPKELGWGMQDQVFSQETALSVTRMLVEVVDTSLLNGRVKVPTMSIAAKTGTAQISAPTGGYYDDRYLHSFFGYFPAYEPRFIIFLFTVEPKEVRYASETLTYPFMNLVSFLTNYYELPPDRGEEVLMPE